MGNSGLDAVLTLLLLRLGQITLLCGTVRSKNAASAGVRGLLDLAVAVLALWAVGAAFDPWDSLLHGRPIFAAANIFGVGGLRAFFVWLPGILIATAAVLGATAERARMTPTLLFAGLLAAVLLPFAAEWITISAVAPMIAAQGIGMGAVMGGTAGLVLAKAAGPRKVKFNRDLSANLVPGHAVAWQGLGLLLIAAGLSPTGGAGLLLGLAAALLASAGFARWRFGVIDVPLLIAGGLGGVLAATAQAGVPTVGRVFVGEGGAAAVLAGVLAGVLTPALVVLLESRWRIDDVGGSAAAALVGGVIGPLVGFAVQWPSDLGHYAVTGGRTAAVWIGAAALSGGLAWVLGRTFGRRGTLRVGEAAEFDGLDLAEHDLNAYPDFQQSMIKSHHLRQL